MLADFIALTRGDPFVWGQNDCALWAASAVRFETGFDPAADLRGTYSRASSCRRMIQRAGGLLRLIEPRMRWSGLRDLSGDGVAVLSLDDGHEGQTLCGLILDGRAVLRMKTGLQISDDFTVLRGWSW
ncbi:DUF6950 family protein [Pacificoceanicola onchidii]|uniref:DUF6950 family protein n=1 Tax=Pacificoceanicola onchidii TaxID=2562685 RepID=UPI0010A37F88|nr:hypothetical protein [Pacificoceanicola onchidii]